MGGCYSFYIRDQSSELSEDESDNVPPITSSVGNSRTPRKHKPIDVEGSGRKRLRSARGIEKVDYSSSNYKIMFRGDDVGNIRSVGRNRTGVEIGGEDLTICIDSREFAKQLWSQEPLEQGAYIMQDGYDLI
jgi:hypothetical protein